MGAFFDSIHIRTKNSAAVRAALQEAAKLARCNFQVGPPVAGWISVFPGEIGDEPVSAVIARLLPEAILHLMVHDDDFFTYHFYRGGQLIDRYNSCPDYFDEVTETEKQECRGRPELLRDLLPDPNAFAKLKTLLAEDKFTFESERMTRFAELFGIANTGASYDLLQDGDLDDDQIEGRDQFVHIERQREPGDEFLESATRKLMTGDLEGALADFNRAIELNPRAARVYTYRALIKRAQGDIAGAQADDAKAAQLTPK
jgi:hypothetical protein